MSDDSLSERLRQAADDDPGVDRPWWWDVPEKGGPAPLLREAADRIDRLRRWEAIGRDLAAIQDPTVFDNDDTTPSFVCSVCRRGGAGDAPRTAPADHAMSCPWRRARRIAYLEASSE